MDKRFGINADAGRIDGNLEILRHDLILFSEAGYQYVEIPAHGVNAIINGRLDVHRAKTVSKLLQRCGLRCTVHAPNPVNLMNLKNLPEEKSALRSSIEFAYLAGSEILVYHTGRFIPEEEFLAGGKKYPGTAEREEMRLAEVKSLRELAAYAAGLKVNICLENARPYLDVSDYCCGERLTTLLAHVQEINRSNVGITLDFGHAYLAAVNYGFDFLEGVRAVAPYVMHVHLHDNFGKPCFSYEKKQHELLAMGRGDLHLPVGLGEIPVAEALARMPRYTGVLMQEVRSRYQMYCREMLAHLKGLFQPGASSKSVACQG